MTYDVRKIDGLAQVVSDQHCREMFRQPEILHHTPEFFARERIGRPNGS